MISKYWKDDPMVEKFKDFKEVCDALKRTHTISVRQVCEMLQSSRSWVNKYITPFVHHIILMNGRGKRGGINWQMLAGEFNNKFYNDMVFFRDKELYEYIFNHVSVMTRQTIRVLESALLNDNEMAENYLKEKRRILDIMNDKIGYVKYKDLSYYDRKIEENEIKTQYKKIIKNKFMDFLNFKLQPVNAKQRTKTKHMRFYEIPNIKDWQAPHDAKGYGDTDEMIYIQFFNEGRVKVVCHFEDLKGNKGEKVYYAQVPDDSTPLNDDDEYRLIAMQDYLQIRKQQKEQRIFEELEKHKLLVEVPEEFDKLFTVPEF